MVITLDNIKGVSNVYEHNGVTTLTFYCPCLSLANAGINKNTNLRDASALEKQTIKLMNSLRDEPAMFAYRSDAITYTARDVSVSRDSVELEYPDEITESNVDTFGLINGGHRVLAMEELAASNQLSADAYVKVEILAGPGVTAGFVHDIVCTRNVSIRAKQSDIHNQQGHFDILKKYLTDVPYYNRIGFKSGMKSDGKYIEPLDLMTVMCSFSKLQLEYDVNGHVIGQGKKIATCITHKESSVKKIMHNERSFVRNMGYFQQIFDIVSVAERCIVDFATKYPNPRLPLDGARYALIDGPELDGKNKSYPAAPAVGREWILLSALTVLTQYDEESDTYSLRDGALEFLTTDNINAFILKFLNSSELFPSGDKINPKAKRAPVPKRMLTEEHPSQQFTGSSLYTMKAADILKSMFNSFIKKHSIELAEAAGAMAEIA